MLINYVFRLQRADDPERDRGTKTARRHWGSSRVVCPPDFIVSYNQTANHGSSLYSSPRCRRAMQAHTQSGGACLGLGGGSGGCGQSHRIGRVQRQTCWLITEQLLSILHGAELSRASGAETASAVGVIFSPQFDCRAEPLKVTCALV